VKPEVKGGEVEEMQSWYWVVGENKIKYKKHEKGKRKEV
jgi:hypothetical protein